MRTLQVWIVAAGMLLSAAAAVARDVEVFIAPRTTVIPASGKVVFDVYWTNHGFHSEAIPARDGTYNFDFACPGTDYASAGNSFAPNNHAGRNRWLSPRTLIHDQVTVNIPINKRAPLTKVSAQFRGLDCKFDSNTVILRNSAK